MEYHRLTADDLATLASGLGAAAVVRELRASQFSRHLLLLKYVSQQWRAGRDSLDASIEVLAEAQRAAPQVYAEILSDPLIGAWLLAMTRGLRRSGPDACPPSGEVLHLGNVAAAAAVRLGLDGGLAGYVRGGRLTIPTVGEATLDGYPDGPITISVTGGRATVLGSGVPAVVLGEGGGWRELRRLSAAHDTYRCTVTVEDGNPYRDGYHAPPVDRLSADEAADWQALFAGAWELICRHLPERAAEMSIGLRAVVPLVDDGSGAARSGTARDSIWALGLTRPRSVADFVITVVHEFQHSKLSAVLDLESLYVPGGSRRHFAPWRVDARPTSGLIQGVFAFLGVAHAWHRLRAEPGLAETATAQFALVREQVDVGLETLAGTGELTSAGEQFTAGMRAGLDRLLAVPLPDHAVERARSAIEERRSAWRLRHPDLVTHAL
jgi:HEXXH motif-containing protein